uniref:Uncharacterized protein n=1 Tax=Candidatus Kentrum sp. FW TaxID=2126338 RepID=A0A450TJE2_9GAMM|nr:MAG: hypothetical protein BECKFW1821C_GA0114237_10129 [Candidatus Kentron sp. FW]
MLRLQTGVFRQTGQHSRTDFLGVMEDEYNAGITRLGEGLARAGHSL